MIHAHILCYNGADIFLYSARHYCSFCDRVFLHDMGSTDGTLDIAAQFGIEVVPWDTRHTMDDRVNQRIKDECWIGKDADWAMVVDTDEIIYFPHGVHESLKQYDEQNIAVAKPHGFEMLHDAWPTTPGQIYDEAKHGAAHVDYCKPVLFAPKRLKSLKFSTGAHSCDEVVLANGKSVGTPKDFASPKFYLLHYHQIGPIERIARLYDERTARMCQSNIQNKWGNQEPGIKHAHDKRNLILSRLEQVVP